jgi:hypothetical protein
MSLLSQVTTGAGKTGIRAVIAAVEGMGKTSLLASAPRCLLVQLEDGAKGLNVHKTPLVTSWEALGGLLDEIVAACRAKKFPYQTIGFDSATAGERLIDEYTIKTDPAYKAGNPGKISMETGHGGYGKAYSLAKESFNTWLRYCDILANEFGINIVFTCHVFSSRVIDPAVGEFHSWDLLLHSPKNEKNYGKRETLTQWADLVGFLHEPMFVSLGKGETVARAGSLNQGRVLAVDRTPAWVAKNRFGLTGVLPIPKEKGWNSIAHAIYEATRGSVDVFNRD